ncbi:integration host factor, actinobacterial type [Psychromicrobium lacuslunae]|uniref:DNA-binding protein n=1 Tax=Psychromicrobium lacuslunae TaxID=1618207 RepID=A0A0D4BXF3_9MICC|nr:integration host factor, actinobacterial type [Psychromicrobium lacuslunae]AJT40988.1 DNA-binding protein [Psychromicrobium lacuslunae]
MSLRPLTAEERASALEKAAQARTIRAEAKNKLKAGKVTVGQLIVAADTEEALGRLKVTELLEALPGIGQVRAAAIMDQLSIANTRRLRGLGVHQRKALIELIDSSPRQAGS